MEPVIRLPGKIALLSAIVAAFAPRAVCAQCPAIQAPVCRAYQSGATTVELVVADSTIAGADHWEVSRTKVGQGPVQILPGNLASSTTSIVDQGQGLESGATYTYSLTVEDAGGVRTAYAASVVDVGNIPPRSLGSTLTVSTWFGFDPGSGARLFWPSFPEPIGRVYAKYFGSARDPATNAALACATVTVRDSASGLLAPLFADRYGKFSHPNPMSADRHGAFEFYAENGTYDIEVSAGASGYALTAVTVFDPRAARVARAGGEAALTLTTLEQAGLPPDGNVHLEFTRPNSTDPNNPPIPYRLLANESVDAWAFTFNLGRNEATGAAILDDPVRPAFFLRVNRAAGALEFGVDPAYGSVDGGPWLSRQPLLETLLRAGPDRTQFKSVQAPVAAEVLAATVGITAGQIVVQKSDGTVKRATAGALHPFAVVGVDTPSGISSAGSRVYLAIAGRSFVQVRGTYELNDPLVAGPNGLAQADPGETDTRYIVGYAQRQGGVPGADTWVQTNAR
jgi:hypothetical protein